MNVDRDTVRVVLPPLLALALVVLLVSPLSASSDAAPAPAGPASGGAITALRTPQAARAAGVGGAQVVSATVPVVVFARDVTVVAGHLRTPVMLTDPARAGSVAVPGASGCTTALRTDQVTWIDCRVSAAGPLQLVAALDDGRTFVTPVAA